MDDGPHGVQGSPPWRLRFTGSCSVSGDGDHDNVGDACDNCPDVWQVNQDQQDTDGDGVGDVCDTCKGDHPYGKQAKDDAVSCAFSPDTSTDDQYCVGKTGDPSSRCTYLGACTGGLDDDGDDIGNACDGCRSTANPYNSQTQMNCNIDTEILYGSYPYLTDECDPNPCTYSYFRDVTTTATPNGGEVIWNLVEIKCDACGLLDEIANMVLSRINPVETHVLAVTRKGARDLTESMSAPVLDVLSEADVRWIVPAEHGHWQRDGAPLFAVMSADASAVRVVGVYVNGMVVPARGATDVIDALALATGSSPAGSSPSGPLPNAAIVLSSTENALFSIGGRAADGTWSSGVLAYSVRTGAWGDVPTTGPRLRKVIAATYHPKDRSLYVIDEGKPSGGGAGRLVRIDLRTLQTEVLGAWPRHGWFDRVFLTLGWDGTVILASSSSSKNKHAITSLELRDKAHPKAKWAVAGSGQLALPPTFADQSLTVPMVTANGVQNEVIRREDLPKPHGQGIGSCL